MPSLDKIKEFLKRQEQVTRISDNTDQVIVYSRADCFSCMMVKEYLKNKGIDFIEKDVSGNELFKQEALDISGVNVVPVVDVFGKVLIGFNEPAIVAALESKQHEG